MEEVFLHGVVLPSATCASDAPLHDRMACGGLSALVSAAPLGLTDFSPDALAQVALAHHAVLQAYCQSGPVLPMKFGTVFSSAEAVKRHLEPEADGLVTALQSLCDQREYNLRLIVTGDPAQGEISVRTGREFLSRGKTQRDLRRTLGENRMALSQTVAQEVLGFASRAEPSTPRADRLLDMFVTLPATAVSSLAALLERFGPRAETLGLALSATGPWPAYGFTLTKSEADHGA